jgi:hypothetical protein
MQFLHTRTMQRQPSLRSTASRTAFHRAVEYGDGPGRVGRRVAQPEPAPFFTPDWPVLLWLSGPVPPVPRLGVLPIGVVLVVVADEVADLADECV